jgi:hypothetical protein
VIQAASLMVIGLQENQVYFFRILPTMLAETSKVAPENLATGRYLQEFFGLAPLAAKRIGQAFALLLFGVLFYAGRGTGRHAGGRGRLALEYSLFLALILIWLPNSWVSYQLLLLPLYLALLREALEPENPRWGLLALLVAGYACLLFYMPCADPVKPWPCAETPLLLGLVRLPRGLHDFLVLFRPLGTLLPVAAGFWRLFATRPARVSVP